MSLVESNSKGITYMLIAVASFAVMNALAKMLHHIPSHELVFFRSIIVFFISLYYVLKLKLPILGNNTTWLILRGVSGLSALLLFFMTLKNMPLASATSLQYLSPIFTVLFASVMNNQSVRPVQWLYFFLAFCGVLMIKGFDDRVNMNWLMVGVLAALIAGFAYNSIIKCRKTDHAYTIVIHLTFISLPVTGIWCLFDFVMPQGTEWLVLLCMGVSTQVAQYYSTKALMTASAATITPWNYVGALFSVIIGYFFFQEGIEWLAVIGMCIIVVSLILNSRLKEIASIEKSS